MFTTIGDSWRISNENQNNTIDRFSVSDYRVGNINKFIRVGVCMTRGEFLEKVMPIMEECTREEFLRFMCGFTFSFVAADVRNSKKYDNERFAHVEVESSYGKTIFVVDFQRLDGDD